ncbi:hypothetical protein KFL_000030390 [Klebsormidium nitens]|uniref:Uncharacterized protein n=1 Tax=Klebsormidium nitens TaxID=105231 RepID=A0A1Y1HLB3_KLENI|nr:hypothetical protein KFL_000030390 [Klebsormidium nitens]|eukprot:GAQ77761.1 hypothetical protein KFL_000030390 [Klebsormidium nitens]
MRARGKKAKGRATSARYRGPVESLAALQQQQQQQFWLLHAAVCLWRQAVKELPRSGHRLTVTQRCPRKVCYPVVNDPSLVPSPKLCP